MSIAVGIDLGTTFSAIAYVNPHGIAEVLPNAEGDRITPSVILFENDDVIVGTYAKQAATVYPDQVVEFIKRHVGDPDYRFNFRGQGYSPVQLSHYILNKLKHDAETRLGTTVDRAVITVPAYFTDVQRRATQEAGRLAGLEVLGLLNEPTAAAIAYGLDSKERRGRILVFDLGGGTFDVTICDIDGSKIDVMATRGDHRLGGKDWDDAIINHVAEAFIEKHGADPRQDQLTAHDLRAKATQAKVSLSRRPKVNIFADYAGNVLRLPLSREDFEGLSADLLGRCEAIVKQVLDEAKLTPKDIDTVLLAGGSTRMPMVREMLGRMFGKEPATDIDPDEAIALGAAVQAAALAAQSDGDVPPIDFAMHDVTSHSLGLAVIANGQLHNALVLPRNTRVPCAMTRDDITTTYDGQTSVDLWLVQGEDSDPLKCTVLGHFEFYGLESREAGKTRLAVTYRYTADALVEVEAIDVATGQVLPFRMGSSHVSLGDAASGQAPTQVIAVVDTSGSMFGPPLDRARVSLRDLTGMVLQRPLHELSIVTVPEGVRQLPTSDGRRLYRAVDELAAIGHSTLGHTLEQAMKTAPPTSGVERLWIIMTDGMIGDGPLAQAAIRRLRQQGAKVVIMPLGERQNVAGLQALAGSPSAILERMDLVEFPSGRSNLATQINAE